MNNKKTITVCSIIALIILAVVIIITIMSDLAGFGIILGALFIILIVCLGIYLKEEPDEYSAFIKNKKRILRTYDSIIVEVEDIPNIAGKNIIKVKSIEDLVDAQLELREPIYYKNDNDSCFFMLLHYNEACIYILKMNDSVVSPTEQSIRYMKEDKDTKDESENILNNVENTIIYKLDELRSFKISPVRNEEKIEVVDDTAIKQEIEESKEQKITKEALEDEISKTMYINDLKEKIKQFEAEELEKEATLLNIDEETNIKEIEIEKINDKKTTSKEEIKQKSKKTTKKAPAKKKIQKKVTHQERRTIKHKKATK
ncbi:MAG: DUF5305 family protein [Candidatus Coprovivens sp.]